MITERIWDGIGLPPVGCYFEYGSHRTLAKCLGVGTETVFACKSGRDVDDYEEFLISIPDSSFHAVRTDAERKREAAVNAMRESLGHAAGLIEVNNIYRAIAAGKIPGVRLGDDS